MTLKASDLSGELKEQVRPDVDGEKTLTLKISPGRKPEVVFTGFWTGRYIKAAMDSIAKSYRLTRRMVQLPTNKVAEPTTQPKVEGGK